MIDQIWYTERLSVSDSLAAELPELEHVLVSTSDTMLLEGIRTPDPNELRRWLFEGDLPPNGRKERHRLQTISLKDNDDVIGYLSLYHGYPDAETLYIASLSIRQDCRNNGFGGEVVDRMPYLIGLNEYPEHRLVVTVRNWGAVRFWARHGFTKVTKVIGNLHLDDGSSARLTGTQPQCCSTPELNPWSDLRVDRTRQPGMAETAAHL